MSAPLLLLFSLLGVVVGELNSKYIGCYKDVSLHVRLFSDGFEDMLKELTPARCIQSCHLLGASYAGLQYGHECFCSKSRPPYTRLVDESACSMKCEGDETQICGDSLRLSVYQINFEGRDRESRRWVGCYSDTLDSRMLPHAMHDYPGLLTPEFCMGHCWRNGYRYSGVQYGTECHCGDVVKPDNKVDEKACSTPCSGDRNVNCGGLLKLSVYSTAILDEWGPDRQVGCYVDDNQIRLLSGTDLQLKETNSPRRCANLCLSLGYKYSGVQYKVECFCGNRKPPSSLEVSESECLMPCPADPNEHCGGPFRLLVYSTGKNQVDVTTIGPDPEPTTPSKVCLETVTTVNGKEACKGEVIFEDDFNKFQRLKWIHSILMPWSPDYEFVTFTTKNQNSYVKDGKLFIKPTLLDDDTVRRGRVSLTDCTGEMHREECERAAVSYFILPPVDSARLTTKETFSFKYGRIDIRASLPSGDWITPEVWLEPVRRVYGRGYRSGRVRIATARGNPSLTSHGREVGSKLLESGVLVGRGEAVRGRSVLRSSPTPWTATFHNYSLIWTPNNLTFLVDGMLAEGLIPKEGEKLVDLIGLNSTDTWHSDSPIAPFDQEFYISLGLSVGGMRHFPDDSVSNGHQKPWRNMAVKALSQFFSDKRNWYATWSEDSTLVIDSVKVTAL